MLPDFELPLILDGAQRALLARDVPAHVFFHGLSVKDDPVAQERWEERLLTRVVVSPRLTPALVARLGTARQLPTLAYLHAVGWLSTEAVTAHAARAGVVGDPRAVRFGAARRQRPKAARMPLSAPGPSVLDQMLMEMASRFHTPPSKLWALPISEFIFNLRTLERAEDREARAPFPR